jgi:hypothetical protein
VSQIISGRGQLQKYPENEVGGIFSRAQLLHEHKMRATTNNFFFAKMNGPRKPEMFYKRLITII